MTVQEKLNRQNHIKLSNRGVESGLNTMPGSGMTPSGPVASVTRVHPLIAFNKPTGIHTKMQRKCIITNFNTFFKKATK